MEKILLASLIGLKPLDRIQINNKEMRSDSANWRVMNGFRRDELPYLFFQRLLPNGRIEARMPGGRAIHVDIGDICDVIPGEPIQVRAIPQSVFIQRNSAVGPLKFAEEDYQAAHVLYVTKDRWNRVDRVLVTFDDPTLNGSSTFSCPIHPNCREMLNATAKRTRLPVEGHTSSGTKVSADMGLDREMDLLATTSWTFMVTAMRGNAEASRQLQAHAIRPVGRA